MIGKTVGSYRIVARLGAGGMGVVYAAEHTLLGKRAAVKVLHPQLSLDPEFVGRFFNEARATTMIRHPGLVDVYDFGHLQTDADAAYLIMELLEGESLATRLGREPLSIGLFLEIVRQIASALVAAHQAGIVHRDLKPDNVFLVEDLDQPAGVRVKVLDFGIAKLRGDASGHSVVKTQTGKIFGTPVYMSPEQCRGAGGVDHRADVYSLGCMMFEMLAGRTPFAAEGSGDLIVAHIRTPAPLLAELVPELPVPLLELVQRMLAKPPSDRPQSMSDVVVALDGLASGRARGADGPVLAARGPTTPVPTTLGGSVAELQRSALPRAGGRAPRLLIAASAIGLAAIAIGARWSSREAPLRAVSAPRSTTVVDSVVLRLHSSPEGAAVRRTGEEKIVGTTPVTWTLPSGSSSFDVTLSLPGWDSETRTIVAERSREWTVVLARTEPSPGIFAPIPASARRRSVLPPASAQPPAPPSVAKPPASTPTASPPPTKLHDGVL